MNVLKDAWDRICAFFIENVSKPMANITLIDVLDILILAFILYRLSRFIRSRRAGRVLLGLALVISVCVVVSLFAFPSLSYISGLLAASAFFCIVVLFQPEIRDALEHLGNCRLFAPRSHTISRKHYGKAEQLTNETVDAVFKMSRAKTGALIVFEGITKLGEYISTGKHLDCEVTSPLLQNIFFNKAPLHDGALIIRDMRIVAACCVLPATRKTLEEDHLGTRHKAAVGVTELSDALVVIVSEQTGTVSVAQDGKLLRGVDAVTLKDVLMTYIAGDAYLNKKRVNLRAEYLQLLDQIGKTRTSKKNEAKEKEKLDRSIQEFIAEDDSQEKKATVGSKKRHSSANTANDAAEESSDQNL